jgi:hypothetical protein
VVDVTPCNACGVDRAPYGANMTDTSGGVAVDLCWKCHRQLDRREGRYAGCAFCGSTAEPSRSTGLAPMSKDGALVADVCDGCRIELLNHDSTPRGTKTRRRDRGLEPGDRVIDGDADGENPSQAVVLRLRDRADEVEVPVCGGTTVAALNPDYATDATVAVVAFKTNLGRELDEWRNVSPGTLLEEVALAGVSTYSYPAPRLALVEDRAAWATGVADLEAFK